MMNSALTKQSVYAEYCCDGENGSDCDEDSELLNLVQSYDWANALRRIASHPSEAASLGMQGRTPLHMACEHDAPAVVVKALLKAFPQALVMVGTSSMNPLHIACSSRDASLHVVQILLEGGSGTETRMRDVDGDTALHAACRCGAPYEILDVLLRADTSVIFERDYEYLTPLLRLWVREFVLLGDDVINAVHGPADLMGELGEAWRKTELLLRAAQFQLRYGDKSAHDEDQGAGDSMTSFNASDSAFRALHTAAAVDCPRAVVRISALVYPDQLEQKDEFGRLPLMIAATSPVHKDHDLTESGYCLEHLVYGDDGQEQIYCGKGKDKNAPPSPQPSVVQILVEASSQSASITDPDGRLALHLAIASGKRWDDGVSAIINAYPDGLSLRDGETGLFPFALAAVGDQAELNTIFELLRSDPSLLQENVGSSKHSFCREAQRSVTASVDRAVGDTQERTVEESKDDRLNRGASSDA